MEYRRLGSTGTTVSALSFGTWRFGRQTGDVLETGREAAIELLDAVWKHGINFIDTANVYGSPNGLAEQYIGEWLEDHDRSVEGLLPVRRPRPPGTERFGAGAQAHPGTDCRQSRASRDGLSGSVLHPPLGRDGRHRGDARDAERPGA